MPVSAPADKRFRRAHVRPTRRTPWRRRCLAALTVATVVLVLAVGAFEAVGYALSSKRLAIRHIAVSGNTRMSSGDVHALIGELIGTNVLTADIEASRRKLIDSHWVAEAEIRRVFPAAVAVAVAERRAVAVARLGADQFLIDRTGFIIDEFGPKYAEFDLPVVDGLVSGQGGGLLVDEQRAALVARLLAALQTRADLASRVSTIDVSDPRDAALLLTGDTVMVRVGTEHFVERLQTYIDLAAALRERVPDIDYVDLRYGERVVVRPHHPGGAAPARSRNKGE